LNKEILKRQTLGLIKLPTIGNRLLLLHLTTTLRLKIGYRILDGANIAVHRLQASTLLSRDCATTLLACRTMALIHYRISSQWFRYQALQLAWMPASQDYPPPNALTIAAFIRVYHNTTSTAPVCRRHYVEPVGMTILAVPRLADLGQAMMAYSLQMLRTDQGHLPWTVNRSPTFLACISAQIWTYYPSARWVSSQAPYQRHPEIVIRGMRILPLDHVFIHLLRRCIHTVPVRPCLHQQVNQQVLYAYDLWSRNLCFDLKGARQVRQVWRLSQRTKWRTSRWTTLAVDPMSGSNLAQTYSILCSLRTQTSCMMLFRLTLPKQWWLCQRYYRFVQRRLGDLTPPLWYRMSHKPLSIPPLWSVYGTQFRWATYAHNPRCSAVPLCRQGTLNTMLTSSQAFIKQLHASGLCTSQGSPEIQLAWLHEPDEQIIGRSRLLDSQYHELYSGTLNTSWLKDYVNYLSNYGCLKTLAWKHKTYISAMLANSPLTRWQMSNDQGQRPTWILRYLPRSWR